MVSAVAVDSTFLMAVHTSDWAFFLLGLNGQEECVGKVQPRRGRRTVVSFQYFVLGCL